MPRVARQLVDGCIYHLINRGNGQQRVFHKDRDYQAFTEMLAEMSSRYAVEMLAWCLMPNHYHLVVRPQVGTELSRGMHWFQTTHARRYHLHYGSSGHLWQGRYKSFAINESEQLLTVIRYVEGNPVRANMVESTANWPWSSHHQRIAGTGSEGACPPDSHKMFESTAALPRSSHHQRSAGTGSEGACPPDSQSNNFLAPLPIELPQPWTVYVDTPITGPELTKSKNQLK
ncbi:REP-associated tyrosine transposase [Geopsychrobacter electrodiphilus]|uniref:REP-associated tyrosine transposase n=1 Tax=Geopsychrobacter electrodiphilus TaxID=225196 RepID=UPI000360C9E3|nr:transposase [Geopsychrobacter electrodiphilus]